MTNSIYSPELKTFIKENFYGQAGRLKSEKMILKCFPKEAKQIINATPFLSCDTPVKIRSIYITKNLTDEIKCKICTKQIKITKISHFNKKYCSHKCSLLDPDIRKKQSQSKFRKLTNLSEKEVFEKTNFLPENTPFVVRTLYLKHGLDEQKHCKICEKKLHFKGKDDFYNKKYCSRKCAWNDEGVKHKKNETEFNKLNTKYTDYNEVIEKTKFLPTNTQISVRLAYLKNNITEQKKCKICEKLIKIKCSTDFGKEYCSGACASQDNKVQNKIRIAKTNKLLKRLTREEVLKKTDFLTDNTSLYIRFLYIENGIAEQKRCKTCNEPLSINNKYQFFNKQFCSYVCMGNNEELKNKIDASKKKTNIMKYGREYHNQKHILNYDEWENKEIFLQVFNDKSFNEVLNYFNVSSSNLYKQARKFGIIFDKHTTTGHQDYIDYIKSLDENIKIEVNIRSVIAPLELDIYLPDYNLAIEFNGIYWHTEGNGKDRHYHLNKTLLCEEKGIQLLHIFENENEEIWKSVISSKLGFSKRIYARKCKVKEITNNNIYSQFLKLNHLQGYSIAKYKYGLFYDDELVAVMSFSKSRYNKKYNYELIRYCNKRNTTIVGGASKLLSHFRKIHNGTIISYANRRWSNGNLYKQLNFKQIKTANPNYFYVIDGNLKSRLEYQKHKLSNKLNIFNDELTEWENMQLNGYDRIWDCGNLVFVSQ